MAINTITDIPIQSAPVGEVFMAVRDLAGPASYSAGAANGQAVSAQLFGFGYAMVYIDTMGVTSDGLFIVQATSIKGKKATAKLRWYSATTGAEVAGATNLSGSTIRLMAYGN